jgi:DNA-binding Xre family transcriptional regulator
MEIRAYDELYLNNAQDILGHAVDFAINSLAIDPDLFGSSFTVSDASKQFAAGNPAYVAGISGCELARIVIRQTHLVFHDTEDVMYLDKSPEYWAGWALAFYQWHSSLSFMDILNAVPLSVIISIYPVYHEMDITHFTEDMDKQMKKLSSDTRLRTKRLNSGLSQSQLAAESGVSIRQIQLFEQRKRDINNTAAITLLRLSKALHCRMEDLIEYL